MLMCLVILFFFLSEAVSHTQARIYLRVAFEGSEFLKCLISLLLLVVLI